MRLTRVGAEESKTWIELSNDLHSSSLCLSVDSRKLVSST